jgi:hypothetical protein
VHMRLFLRSLLGTFDGSQVSALFMAPPINHIFVH